MQTQTTINHPNMAPRWFDTAVNRAHANGCRVIESGKPGILFVTSGSHDGICYRVTRESCTCEGHRRVGRCQHRALAIAYADVFRPRRRRSTPIDPSRFIVRRGSRFTPEQLAVIDAFIVGSRDDERHAGQTIAAALDGAREDDETTPGEAA